MIDSNSHIPSFLATHPTLTTTQDRGTGVVQMYVATTLKCIALSAARIQLTTNTKSVEHDQDVEDAEEDDNIASTVTLGTPYPELRYREDINALGFSHTVDWMCRISMTMRAPWLPKWIEDGQIARDAGCMTTCLALGRWCR